MAASEGNMPPQFKTSYVILITSEKCLKNLHTHQDA